MAFAIHILQIAPTKNSEIKALEALYEKRLQPFAKLTELSLTASVSDQRARVQEEEKELFLNKLDPDATLLCLDETGKSLSSEEFADWLGRQKDLGPGKLQCLIGGSHGLHPDLKQKADLVLSLSKMTFTHEMVRPFFKEQLYRAFMILSGKTYHK